MEKIDIEKEFKKYDGDFRELPKTYAILGFKNISFVKKGQTILAPVLVCQREDGEEITLFADQLRKEGSALFVSEAHLQAQIKRQEAWRARSK